MNNFTFEELVQNHKLQRSIQDSKIKRCFILTSEKKKPFVYVVKKVKINDSSQIESEKNFTQLDSKYIAKCFGFQIEQQKNQKIVYIFMESLPYGNIYQFCQCYQKKFAQENIQIQEYINLCLYILSCCLKALSYLKEQKIGHRDIKPSNIGIGKDGYIKIFDFGISKKYQNTQDQQYTFIGTQNYLAPELFQDPFCSNFKYQSSKTDIFALGVSIYYLLYNKHPYLEEEIQNKYINDRQTCYQKRYKQLIADKAKPKFETKDKSYKEINSILEEMLQLKKSNRKEASELIKIKILKDLARKEDKSRKEICRLIQEFRKKKIN